MAQTYSGEDSTFRQVWMGKIGKELNKLNGELQVQMNQKNKINDDISRLQKLLKDTNRKISIIEDQKKFLKFGEISVYPSVWQWFRAFPTIIYVHSSDDRVKLVLCPPLGISFKLIDKEPPIGISLKWKDEYMGYKATIMKQTDQLSVRFCVFLCIV